MFAYLALSHSHFYKPIGFWKAFKDYDGEPINVREHQDAYEFFTRLQVVTCPGSAVHSQLPDQSGIAALSNPFCPPGLINVN